MEDQKRSRGSAKAQDFNHTREDIFALPSMQLHLKTEHLQAAFTPDGTGRNIFTIFFNEKLKLLNFHILNYFIFSGEKPTVECSFITEFEDHIFVTIDAEAFFFLHDLISSYVKERERIVSF